MSRADLDICRLNRVIEHVDLSYFNSRSQNISAKYGVNLLRRRVHVAKFVKISRFDFLT